MAIRLRHSDSQAVDLSTWPVQTFMTVGAQCDQVRVIIIALLAAQLLVDLKVLFGTTDLASPSVALQHLFSELVVRLGIKPQARSLGTDLVHEAFSVTSFRKACRCSPGRDLKNLEIDCNSTVGSSFSRLAPARKSAQIISRQ